jgi:signal transduction histidine kinase
MHVDTNKIDEQWSGTEIHLIKICRLVKDLEDEGDIPGAWTLLTNEITDLDSYRHPVKGVTELIRAEVLLCLGSLKGKLANNADSLIQEEAKNLLTQAITIFENYAETKKEAQGQSELANCYFNEGYTNEALIIYSDVLKKLSGHEGDLKLLTYIRKADAERASSLVNLAKETIEEAKPLVDSCSNYNLRGKFHNTLATIIGSTQDLESKPSCIEEAVGEYQNAAKYFEHAGNKRYQAFVENNIGWLLYRCQMYEEAHLHLNSAEALFTMLKDEISSAQANETRARVYLAQGEVQHAESLARSACLILERSDRRGLYIEALTTHGIALARLSKCSQAKHQFLQAAQIAEEANTPQDAGRVLLTLIEEINSHLSTEELEEIYDRAATLLSNTEDSESKSRLEQSHIILLEKKKVNGASVVLSNTIAEDRELVSDVESYLSQFIINQLAAKNPAAEFNTSALRELTRNPGFELDKRATLCCVLAKVLQESGNHEYAQVALEEFWPEVGKLPKITGLKDRVAAELLLTVGSISIPLARAKQMAKALDVAVDILAESKSRYTILGLNTKVAEVESWLGWCYYSQGKMDEATASLSTALDRIGNADDKVLSLILIRLAIIESSQTRPYQALQLLKKAEPMVEADESLYRKGLFHNVIGTLFNELGKHEFNQEYLKKAIEHLSKASQYFSKVSNHRNSAATDFNLGELYATNSDWEESLVRFDRARKIFVEFKDFGFTAQVDEARARAFLRQGLLADAESTARSAVHVLENGGNRGHLTKALITYGTIQCQFGKIKKGRTTLERAINIAESSGNDEGVGLAALAILEGVRDLGLQRYREFYGTATAMLAKSQNNEIRARLECCAKNLIERSPKNKEQGNETAADSLSDPDSIVDFAENKVTENTAKSDNKRLLVVIKWIYTVVGLIVVFYSLINLPTQAFSFVLLLIAAFGLVANSRVFEIPSTNATLSFSEVVTFFILLTYGQEAAVLYATLDAAILTAKVNKKKLTILASAAIIGVSTFITGVVLTYLFGDIFANGKSGFSIEFISTMTLCHYFSNGTLASIVVSKAHRETIWTTWKRIYLWIAFIYVGAGLTATLIANVWYKGPGITQIIIPLAMICAIYQSYVSYIKGLEANAEKNKQAEQHIKQLSIFIAEQEKYRRQMTNVEKLAALRELSSGVAHHFNNALAGIMGRSQLLLRHTKKCFSCSETVRADVGIIMSCAEEASRKVKVLQESAHQRKTKVFKQLDVKTLLSDVAELSRPKWASAANKILVEITGEPNLAVQGDPADLCQALSNLVYNAVDAMVQGGTITLDCSRSNSNVVIRVQDSGIGIPPEIKDKIFDQFFTTKGVEGDGLGLSYVMGVIQRHDGTVEMESKVGEGTSVIINLPCSTANNITTEQMGDKIEHDELKDLIPALNKEYAAPPLGVTEVAVQEGLPKLLIVDDEDFNREMLKDMLSSEGFNIYTAENGKQALDIFKTNEIFGVLTDIGMPEMNGWELIREIRATNSTIPIAIVTGWGEQVELNGANWLIPKPYDINQIIDIGTRIKELIPTAQ